MTTLGGSIFTHNVLKFDYCIREAIESLCVVCDEVVVLDAQSTDGTIPVLYELQKRFPHLTVVTGAKWEVGEKYDRLAIIANQAASYLKSDWHFMLQADEVIHENSIEAIRFVIENPGDAHTFIVRRFNLYGDFNHHVSLTSERKPCSDSPVRIGLRGIPVVGDAEALMTNRTANAANIVSIFHYGFVRKSQGLFDKTISMQSWFHGPGSQPDERIVDMKAKNQFDPYRIIPREEMVLNTMPHPKYMTNWIQEREAEQATWVK